MPRKYRKDYISRNGNNYYLQFHISEWMRQLPAFRNYPVSKKNFKKTLRTDDYYLAVQRANALLIDMQIKQPPPSKPVTVGAEAFMETLQHVELVPNEQLESLYDDYSEVFHSFIAPEGEFGERARVEDEASFSHAKEGMAAIEREMKRRRVGKFFDEPMPHKITLKYAAEKYMEEMASEGRPKKTQSKVKNAAKRFLEFRELPDMELERITPKLVNQYIKQARIEERAENTFKNDIHYLGSVFNWAKQEGWMENIPNPFRDLRIRGFKPKVDRRPFTLEMLFELKESREVLFDDDIRRLFWISYYSGMRISEVYSAKFKTVDGILCFDVASEGGKTASARRIIPLHSFLYCGLRGWESEEHGWCNGEYGMEGTKDGMPVEFNASSAAVLGKRFGRFKDRFLDRIGKGDEKAHYGHHSFRHGFITMLLRYGYSEVEIADLTGHKKSNIGRTEAGKTYFHRQDVSKLKEIVDRIMPLH